MPLEYLTFFFSRSQNNTGGVCSVRYFTGSVWNSLFSLTPTGNLTWSNPSLIPSQSAYELRVVAQQNCSSLLQTISKDIIVNFRNLPSSTVAPSTNTSAGMDSTTVYAIIAGVAAFILIVMAILFIVLYYRIQRAKHRVPPFFQSHKHSPAHGLAFLKSKSPLSPSSPYILDVRDDDSSNSTSSDRTTSSPLHNRLLSGHYKVTEPPVNTTIEELLSSYDNRSTSSSSSSSGLGDQIFSPSLLGTFRPGSRVDPQQLDTINEDLQWMNTSSRPLNSSRVSRPSDDAMDIISESHEVEHRRELLTNCVASTSSLPLTTTTTSTSTHFFFSSSPCSSTDSSHTLETNRLTNSSPQVRTRC